MSSDPKKPAFDAPPSNTPDLLQKDMSLDRRKRVPSFEELQGAQSYSDLPTEPARPVIARPAALPQATVVARPSRDDVGTQSSPTIPIPPGMQVRQAPRPATPAAPLQPPRAGAPTAPLVQAPRTATPAAAPQAPRAAIPAAPAQAPRAAAPPAPAQAPRAAPAQAPRAAAPPAPAQAPRPDAPPAPAPQAPRAATPAAPVQAPRAAAASAPAPQAPRTGTPTVPARAPAPPAEARPAPSAPPPRPIAEAEAWNAQQQQTRGAAAAGQDQVTRASAPHRPPGARAEPPSPVEFAQARPAAPVPQVTPHVPSQGAVVPDGQNSMPERAQPTLRPSAPRTEPLLHDEPEPRTNPAGPSARSFTPQPAPSRPMALPAEMLVTQPGLPGPFAARQAPQPLAIPERGPSAPEMPAAPAPSELNPALVEPQFDEQQPMDDTVTAEPAALWRRTFAWLADLTFVGCLVLGFLAVAVAVIAPKNLTPAQQLAAIAAPAAGLAALLAFVYTTLFAFLWRGRTPGRRMMGLHLVDVSGHAPGPARALVRALLSLVSFGLFLSGFWLALFDRHGQTLHDKLTRTFVVKLQDA